MKEKENSSSVGVEVVCIICPKLMKEAELVECRELAESMWEERKSAFRGFRRGSSIEGHDGEEDCMVMMGYRNPRNPRRGLGR